MSKKINNLVHNAPQTKWYPTESTSEYSFEDIRKHLKEFIKEYKDRGYFLTYNFPNLIRVSRINIESIMGEFTPNYIVYYNDLFKRDLFQFSSKFEDYLNGLVKIGEPKS